MKDSLLPALRPETRTEAYGFPFPCIQYFYTYTPTRASESNMAISYNWSLRCILRPIRLSCRFPLCPMVLGLVFNTLAYAALFATPWTFRSLRRCLRRHRGRCPFCGYELRGEFARPCPECGTVSATSPAPPG